MQRIKTIKTKFKVSDNVVITSGADKGKRGKILKIDRQKSRVIVEGINKRSKFIKANQENPNGGMVTYEFPINLSNVMVFCEKCKQGVRVSMDQTGEDKLRKCTKCGKSLDK